MSAESTVDQPTPRYKRLWSQTCSPAVADRVAKGMTKRGIEWDGVSGFVNSALEQLDLIYRAMDSQGIEISTKPVIQERKA